MVLPHWNFNHDHYNKAPAEKLAPYNFTTYWLDVRDPEWYLKYEGYLDSFGVPDTNLYLEPVTHQYYSRPSYKNLDHPWATTLFI